MKRFSSILLATALLCAPVTWAQENDDDDYVDIPTDLASGMPLLEVAERAHDHVDDYYELAHGHPRNESHDHGPEMAGVHEDDDPENRDEDEFLSAYEAVGEIWLNAREMRGRVDPDALDMVKVVTAVIDAWTECGDTFGAVQRSVELEPDRAAEVAARVAIKKDCNCAAGGIWPQERVEDRIRAEFRHAFIDVPRACSCSQAAMIATITGLPENREFPLIPEEDEAQRLQVTRVMVEKSNEIIERVNAAQNRNNWDCSCSDVNLAATMRGIEDDDLREGTWEGLSKKYADEAGDTGLVVDIFGTVGMHPVSAWGSEAINSARHTLRRQPRIYRGDPLIMDPFDPSVEWTQYDEFDFTGLDSHLYGSDNTPTDIFMSEYIESWNQAALAKPFEEREENERNRVLELYNGADRDIDLGQGQYLLEIYSPEDKIIPAPPVSLVRHTLTIESGVTFDLDKWDIRPEASETLRSIVEVINDADIFSEILIVGHTCDIATDEYNQLLSERRAQSVKDYLENLGLRVDAIRTEGQGEQVPRLPNISEENRSQNRRVEITFVTRSGREIERTVSEEGGKRKVEFSWVAPGLAPEDIDSERTLIPLVFGDEHWLEGSDSPREVIGLNGRIEAGGTFIIAYDNSDEEITDIADIVTGQLDFDPMDTLVIRRFGGTMALSCRAHTYAYLFSYPPFVIPLPEPLRPLPDPICTDLNDCEDAELGSPN